MNKHHLLALLLAAVTAQAAAQTVYRTVNEDGTVSFSDEPPGTGTRAAEIEVKTAAPSAEEQEQSRNKADEMVDRANQASGQNNTASQDGAAQTRAIEQSLESAQQELEEARIVGPGDRRGTASGGSRLTPGYQERVEAAERAVQQKQEALDKAR